MSDQGDGCEKYVLVHGLQLVMCLIGLWLLEFINIVLFDKNT